MHINLNTVAREGSLHASVSNPHISDEADELFVFAIFSQH
jgi:hypothetical protein